MLALKKKREEQKKAAEAAAKAEAAAGGSTVSAPADGAEGGQVSLFGIGGKKNKKKNDQVGTKKTPGEIRIQKGGWIVFYIIVCLCQPLLMALQLNF